MPLSIEQIIEASWSRCKRWHPKGVDSWSLLEWAAVTAGEAGEALNAAKKVKRLEDAMLNINTEQRPENTMEDLRAKVAHEGADTILYAVLLIRMAGGDPEEAIRKAFNNKSVEYGFPERL